MASPTFTPQRQIVEAVGIYTPGCMIATLTPRAKNRNVIVTTLGSNFGCHMGRSGSSAADCMTICSK